MDQTFHQKSGAQHQVNWWRGWLPLLLFPLGVFLFFPKHWPRWALMWTLAVAIYVGCKWLTWRRTPVANVPVWKHAAYLLAWPGLDAKSFLSSPIRSSQSECHFSEWLIAAVKTALGIAIFWGGAGLLPPQYPYLAGWLGMIGIVTSLHFGLFHLLSCLWRTAGIDARPLMNSPFLSTNISEFWGLRWNTAFRDLTHRFLFRPLTPQLGPAKAVFAGFVFSGIVHDIVISIPADGGYGGPTLFFTIQGLAILLSRSNFGKRLNLRNGIAGRLFTFVVLICTVMALFHPPFVNEIIVPFMKSLGAVQ